MARSVGPEKKHDYWVRQWHHRRDYYKQENDLYGRLIAFALDQEHYKRNRGFSNDSTTIQPKGQQLLNLIRHKLALLVTPPVSIDARPVQPLQDANAAMVSRRIIEQVVEDPKRRYKSVRHRMVLSGLAGGRGSVAIEWDHSVNGVVLRNMDPRRLFPTPGFLDLHDPRVPDVIEEVPMRLSQVKRMAGWNVPASLTADNWTPDHPQGASQESKWIDMDGSSEGFPGVSEGTDDDGIVTVLKCYSRRDPFQQTKQVNLGMRDLPESEWYWTNDAGERVPMMQSPEQPADGFRLVTRDEDQRELELYSSGYLCIIAPFSPTKKPLWEGSWLPDAVNTDVRLRSFPYMDFAPYLHPLRRAGKCDTQLNHSLQLIDNASFRAAWEQMRSAQAIMVMLKGTVQDAQGRPFEPSDKPLQMAYATDRIAMEGISFHQAPGMNAALPQFRNMLDRQWSYIGSGDIAMPADRSRDIAVGTIQAMQQSGDLPVQMHRDILHAEEAIAFGVILDYTRAYRQDQEIVQWVTDNGELANASVTGADLVDVNVTINSSPDFRALDADRIQAIAQFAGQMATNPQLMATLAPFAGIPPEGVREIRAAVAQMQQQPQPTTGGEQDKPKAPAAQSALPAMPTAA